MCTHNHGAQDARRLSSTKCMYSGDHIKVCTYFMMCVLEAPDVAAVEHGAVGLVFATRPLGQRCRCGMIHNKNDAGRARDTNQILVRRGRDGERLRESVGAL